MTGFVQRSFQWAEISSRQLPKLSLQPQEIGIWGFLVFLHLYTSPQDRLLPVLLHFEGVLHV